MAHARRKFFDLHVQHKSELAQLSADERRELREARGWPIAQGLHAWMIEQRGRVSPGSAIAKALDYSLKRWAALTRYLADGLLPIDNNWVENQIRPWATGRGNWLFAGSLRAGKRGAAVMSLIRSAQLNGHDPYVYLKDVLTRLPTHKARNIAQLLPHHWKPANT